MATLKKFLIIIGATLPYSFPTDYIKQTAKILGLENKVIIFSWGESLSLKEIFKQRFLQNKKFKLLDKKPINKSKQIILFKPIQFIPLRRFELIQNLNLILNVHFLKLYLKIKSWDKLRKICWVFNYKLYHLSRLLGKSYLSLYDCVDFFSSLDKKTNQEIKIKQEKLIKNTDFFFVNSRALKTRFKKYKPIVVPQGFDLTSFKKFNQRKAVLKKAKSSLKQKISLQQILKQKTKGKLNQPLIGYLGGINYRLDFQLLFTLIKKNPQWQFVFVGQKQNQESESKLIKAKEKIKKLLKLNNVYHLKNQPKSKLPLIINQFDLCLIPYNPKIEFNQYCYPMKIFEYFYQKKPVVSTLIYALKPLQPYVKIGKNSKDFEKAIKKILAQGWPEKYRKEQRKLAIKNSWENKIKAINRNLSSRLNQS